jgi:trans-aconitate methyltransferase
VDISSEMVKVAKNINPQLNFETADILNLKYPGKNFGSVVAFYNYLPAKLKLQG